MSISPRKDSPKKDNSYDDYLMGMASRAKSPSEAASKQLEQKSVNMFKRFEEDEDSLLEFKPIKADATPRKPSIHSVDMMGINSIRIGGGDLGMGGELGMDTNKPGRPLIPAAATPPMADLPMNTMRPTRTHKQSEVDVDIGSKSSESE